MIGLEAQVRRMADLAWAAGVLDASGAFVAHERKRVNRPVLSGLYIPRIRVRTSSKGQNPPAQLATLRTILGGSVGRTQATNAKGRFEWQTSGAKAVAAALDELMPYLHSRSRQAQLLRELCRLILEDRSRAFDERSLTTAQIHERALLVEALVGSHLPKL